MLPRCLDKPASKQIIIPQSEANTDDYQADSRPGNSCAVPPSPNDQFVGPRRLRRTPSRDPYQSDSPPIPLPSITFQQHPSKMACSIYEDLRWQFQHYLSLKISFLVYQGFAKNRGPPSPFGKEYETFQGKIRS